MKRIYFILIFSSIFTACELVQIGEKRAPSIEVSQSSPVGAIYLFKAELEDSNSLAAAKEMLRTDLKRYPPLERYELSEELEFIARQINKKDITYIKQDTLNESSCNLLVEFSYLTKIAFTTNKVKNKWYITSIDHKK